MTMQIGRIYFGRINQIKDVVSQVYDVTPVDLDSARRSQVFVEARHVAMYLAHELTMQSIPQIGRAFGDKDHSTVSVAIKKIKARLVADGEFQQRMKLIRERVAARFISDPETDQLIEIIGDKVAEAVKDRLRAIARKNGEDIAREIVPELFR